MIIQTILDFRKSLPEVVGNLDYQLQRKLFERVDEILRLSKIDELLCQRLIYECEKTFKNPIKNEIDFHTKMFAHAQVILRTTIARNILQMDYRDFAARLADSPLLQRFCLVDQQWNSKTHVPSKSTLQGWETAIPKSIIDEMNGKLITVSTENQINPSVIVESVLKLEAEIELKDFYLDTTCLEAHIHYPVDWVLLRDCVRSLILAIHQIRKYGIKNRMSAPMHQTASSIIKPEKRF
jgi:hypothetical protein